MTFPRDIGAMRSEIANVNRSTFLRLVVATFAAAVSLACSSSPQPPSAQPASGPVVVLKTSLGEIDLQLDPTNAPVTTANFLSYVDKGFYDGTIFHRVIPGFVAQGGGFTPEMQQKPTDAPIKNEAANGLHNVRGSISMARTNDPDSATTQFFLNLVDNTSKLDPGGVSPEGYAVFGKIIKGLDVLDQIAQVQTTTVGDFSDVPAKPVLIISARRQ